MSDPASAPPPRRAARAGANAAVAALALTVGAAILVTWDVAPDTVEAVVAQVVRAAGVAACAWYAVAALVATAVLLVEAAGGTWLTGRRALARCAPRAVRRLAGAGAVAGVALAALAVPSGAVVPANLTSTATASWSSTSTAPTVPARSEPSTTGPVVVTTGLKGAASVEPVPADVTPPPTDPTIPQAAAPDPTADPAPTTYTVRPGDSLWRIAQDHAPTEGPGTGATWQDWYGANRDAVGADPDLIHPGTVLATPGPATAPAATSAPSTVPQEQP